MIKKFKRRKAYAEFKDNALGEDLAGIEWIDVLNIYFLWFFTNYAWV